MRLDKFLSMMGCCSRSEAKKAIREKKILINEATAQAADVQIDPDNDKITFCGKRIIYQQYKYIMLNKPDGVVSATDDPREKTVIDLIEGEERRHKMFPCGRLDKNTLGLMLLTDDGDLAHELLSPKHHVNKKYYFKAEKEIAVAEIMQFENGLTLDDGYVTLPAKIELFDNKTEGIITLTEGKYHQIKRMLVAIDNKITYLERISFGPLELDTSLARGEWRYLTEEEIKLLREHKKTRKQ